ncbi:hypothetical protein UlMin_004651 [Ulmus minor]
MLLPRNNLQMSSCLSGGGRSYAFELDFVKSPSTSTRTSNTSSPPSSTLSESSNSGLAIRTRKPRTPRKRPNQIYNEAATLLSTAYPNVFSTKHLTFPRKYAKPSESFLLDETPELLLPFRVIEENSGFLLLNPPLPEKPFSGIDQKFGNSAEKSCQSPGEFDSRPNYSGTMEFSESFQEDFDAESMLDEEIDEGGIDSIMGNASVKPETFDESAGIGGTCYGYPMGLGFGGRFDFGLGMRRGGIRALRQVDDGNWWCFPTVDVLEISPKFNKPVVSVSAEKKKKKKKVEKVSVVETNNNLEIPKPNSGLSLKLNYDDVLSAWSDKGSPFSDEISGSDLPGNDVTARLAQIDLFPDGGGVREASVLRYKEKRRTRLFSKKIRYQVRKVNADRRPRMKIPKYKYSLYINIFGHNRLLLLRFSFINNNYKRFDGKNKLYKEQDAKLINNGGI